MGPLAGIRVLDLSQIVSGPMAAAWLGDQGAEVIKLESPTGDPVRMFGARKGMMSAMFIAVNRGKKGESLDLKDPASHPRFEELIRWADVLVENFRPGTMEKLGFPYERCAALNPRLVWCAITGFGQDGPRAGLRAYDQVVQAASGMCDIQSDDDGTPKLVRGLVCDKLTALTAAQAITAALFARERNGLGQKVDVAMLDAAVAFNWPDGMYNRSFVDPAEPVIELSRHANLWPTRDGWCSWSMLQDVEFEALRKAFGYPEALADPAYKTTAGRAPHLPKILAAFGKALAERTSAEVMQGFLDTGAPGYTVNGLTDVLTDPQVAHNGVIVEIDHGDLGPVRVARNPARFSGTPNRPVPAPAPRLASGK